MFERFSTEARRTIVLSQEHAKILGHMEILPGHLLLALLTDLNNRPAQMLEGLGLNLSDVATRTRLLLGRNEQPSIGHIQFSAATTAIIERANREARTVGDGWVHPISLLAALLAESEDLAVLMPTMVRVGILAVAATSRA